MSLFSRLCPALAGREVNRHLERVLTLGRDGRFALHHVVLLDQALANDLELAVRDLGRLKQAAVFVGLAAAPVALEQLDRVIATLRGRLPLLGLALLGLQRA